MNIKSFVCGFLTASLLAGSVLVFGETKQNIEVIFGRIHVLVNGTPTQNETLLYNDTTYVPLREVVSSLGATITYETSTQTVIIQSQPSIQPQTTAQPAVQPQTTEQPVVQPQTTAESAPSYAGNPIVYWGNTGSKVHLDPLCRTIRNGVLSGTIDDAKAAGHTEGWCQICSKGYTDDQYYLEGNPFQ